MIRKLYFFESKCFDPYRNLAIEESLLTHVSDCAILFLWQNENTVVIGKNQNPWKECKTALLTEEGGKLARRLSGGGAVYHDLGNLNFTILLPQQDFDLDKQLSVVQCALEYLGIFAEKSGRNDLLVEGRKFSGNAFYKNGKAAYHHGTILVDVDTQKLSRYLSPSKLKLQAKGVDSVRSRVENICHWKPGLTISEVKEAMKQSFSQVYRLPLEPLFELPEETVLPLAQRNASWEWNYGRKIPFTCTLEGRFPWGDVEIALQIESGIVQAVKIYTDAMEAAWPELVEDSLTGGVFEKKEMQGRLPPGEEVKAISSLLENI